jgi:integrase
MNSKVTLVRYALIPGRGWRRGKAVLGQTGRLKPDTMLLGGAEISCPTGRFQMRSFVGKRAIYTDLVGSPSDVMDRFRAAQSKSKAKVDAKREGFEIVEPEEREKETVKAKAKAFIERHRNLHHRAADALDAYIRVLTSFQEVCPNAKYPTDITEDDIITWHGWMKRERKYSDRTAANYYGHLRAFLRYCGLDLEKLVSVGTNKMLRSFTKRVPNYYEPATIQTLIASATDENRALLWDFFWKTGLRKSEMQMVTRFDFEGLDGEHPFVLSKERDEYGQIKDQEERRIELHPSLVEPVKKWLRVNPKRILLFGTESDKTDGKMLKNLKITARNAGLNCGNCKGCKGKLNECSEYTLHRFRRTYCNTLLRATGNDFRSVMVRSGHADIQTLMRYIAPVPLKRDAIAAAF